MLRGYNVGRLCRGTPRFMCGGHMPLRISACAASDRHVLPWRLSVAGAATCAGSVFHARRHGRRAPQKVAARAPRRPAVSRRSFQQAAETDDAELDEVSRLLRAAVERFEQEVRKPDEEIDLLFAAALMALHADPRLDIDKGILHPIDRLAEAFKSRPSVAFAMEAVSEEARPRALANSLCAFMQEQGFHGCGRTAEEYYRAENSLMNQVLLTKRGIPISLSLLYIAVGRSSGLDLYGINFPGHFFLAFGHGKDAGLLDAFENRTVSDEEAALIFAQLFGRPMKLDPSWRAQNRIPNVAFLSRMVLNLRGVYEGSSNLSQAARITQYSQILQSALGQQV